jgi:hypothetical protein
MRRGFAILSHLIEMVGDPIDFLCRIVDRRSCAVGGLGRLVSCVERLRGRSFRARGGLLRSRGGGFGLLGLLLGMRCASRERKRNCGRNEKNPSQRNHFGAKASIAR